MLHIRETESGFLRFCPFISRRHLNDAELQENGSCDTDDQDAQKDREACAAGEIKQTGEVNHGDDHDRRDDDPVLALYFVTAGSAAADKHAEEQGAEHGRQHVVRCCFDGRKGQNRLQRYKQDNLLHFSSSRGQQKRQFPQLLIRLQSPCPHSRTFCSAIITPLCVNLIW